MAGTTAKSTSSAGIITRLDTSNFDAVAVAARDVAEKVEDLQLDLARAHKAVSEHWLGNGYSEYLTLYAVVEQLMVDISDEFIDVYDALCESQAAYLAADQDVATQIDSSAFGDVL